MLVSYDQEFHRGLNLFNDYNRRGNESFKENIIEIFKSRSFKQQFEKYLNDSNIPLLSRNILWLNYLSFHDAFDPFFEDSNFWLKKLSILHAVLLCACLKPESFSVPVQCLRINAKTIGCFIVGKEQHVLRVNDSIQSIIKKAFDAFNVLPRIVGDKKVFEFLTLIDINEKLDELWVKSNLKKVDEISKNKPGQKVIADYNKKQLKFINAKKHDNEEKKEDEILKKSAVKVENLSQKIIAEKKYAKDLKTLFDTGNQSFMHECINKVINQLNKLSKYEIDPEDHKKIQLFIKFTFDFLIKNKKEEAEPLFIALKNLPFLNQQEWFQIGIKLLEIPNINIEHIIKLILKLTKKLDKFQFNLLERAFHKIYSNFSPSHIEKILEMLSENEIILSTYEDGRNFMKNISIFVIKNFNNIPTSKKLCIKMQTYLIWLLDSYTANYFNLWTDDFKAQVTESIRIMITQLNDMQSLIHTLIARQLLPIFGKININSIVLSLLTTRKTSYYELAKLLLKEYYNHENKEPPCAINGLILIMIYEQILLPETTQSQKKEYLELIKLSITGIERNIKEFPYTYQIKILKCMLSSHINAYTLYALVLLQEISPITTLTDAEEIKIILLNTPINNFDEEICNKIVDLIIKYKKDIRDFENGLSDFSMKLLEKIHLKDIQKWHLNIPQHLLPFEINKINNNRGETENYLINILPRLINLCYEKVRIDVILQIRQKIAEVSTNLTNFLNKCIKDTLQEHSKFILKKSRTSSLTLDEIDFYRYQTTALLKFYSELDVKLGEETVILNVKFFLRKEFSIYWHRGNNLLRIAQGLKFFSTNTKLLYDLKLELLNIDPNPMPNKFEDLIECLGTLKKLYNFNDNTQKKIFINYVNIIADKIIRVSRIIPNEQLLQQIMNLSKTFLFLSEEEKKEIYGNFIKSIKQSCIIADIIWQVIENKKIDFKNDIEKIKKGFFVNDCMKMVPSGVKIENLESLFRSGFLLFYCSNEGITLDGHQNAFIHVINFSSVLISNKLNFFTKSELEELLNLFVNIGKRIKVRGIEKRFESFLK